MMIKLINILIGLILLTAGCTPVPEEIIEEDTAPNEIRVTRTQFDANNMKLGKAVRRNFRRVVRAAGVIDVPPQNRAQISAVMGGFVRQVPLLVGNEVDKGQLIAVLENPEFVSLQQEYLEIAEQIAYLESDYERQKSLFEEKITSQKNYLKAESEYKRARATLAGLAANLRMLGISTEQVKQGQFTSEIRLLSPIKGTVTRLKVSLGSYVNPSDLIMEIVDPSHKHLELNVYEKDIMGLEAGQEIRFTVPETSSEIYSARIQLIGRSVDEETRTIDIHGHLKDEDEEKFTVGMFVQAEIILENTSMLAVPQSAILGSGEKGQLLTLKEENEEFLVFLSTPVETSEPQDGYVALRNYADTTQSILVQGVFGLGGQQE